MRTLLFVMAALVALVAAGPSFAQQAAPASPQTFSYPLRERGPGFGVASGAVIGGLLGSMYGSGIVATGSAVGTAISNTASAVGAGAASLVTGVAAAATLPVVVGVVAGGAVGYFIATR